MRSLYTEIFLVPLRFPHQHIPRKRLEGQLQMDGATRLFGRDPSARNVKNANTIAILGEPSSGILVAQTRVARRDGIKTL
jgi:hypothetical protein